MIACSIRVHPAGYTIQYSEKYKRDRRDAPDIGLTLEYVLSIASHTDIPKTSSRIRITGIT